MPADRDYDEQVLEEISLLGEVVSRANDAGGPLASAEIDALLEVAPAPREAPPPGRAREQPPEQRRPMRQPPAQRRSAGQQRAGQQRAGQQRAGQEGSAAQSGME